MADCDWEPDDRGGHCAGESGQGKADPAIAAVLIVLCGAVVGLEQVVAWRARNKFKSNWEALWAGLERVWTCGCVGFALYGILRLLFSRLS